jgi:DNA polymerase-3 subunit alpha
VNRSEAAFSVVEGAIAYALGGLKGVGPEAMRMIAEERRAHGPFRDLFDFARRIDLRRIGKRALEMMARAGAFDALNRNRRQVFESVEALTAYSAATRDEAASQQTSLFGGAAELPAPRLAAVPDWGPTERLAEEHAAIGFYLSGHPLDDYAAALRRKRILFYADLAEMAGRSGVATARIAGSVMKRQEKKSARGARFAFVAVSDPTAMYEVTVFSDTLAQCRDLLEPGCNVVMTVEAEPGGDQLKLLCKGVSPVDMVAADAAQAGLRVWVREPEALSSLKLRLDEARPQRGRRGGPVEIVLSDPELGAEIEIAAPGDYAVTPAMRGAIKAIEGVMLVEEF